MVQVHEIVNKAESDHSDDETSSNAGSDISDVSSTFDDDDVESESLLDRLAALKDVIPPSTRHSIMNTATKISGTSVSVAKLFGKVMWVVSTSALLTLFPLVLEMEKEQSMIMFENEQKMREQRAQQVNIIY